MISKLIQKPYTDIFIQETDTDKKQTTMVGGFDGYLKYKTKYLQLKNKLNIKNGRYSYNRIMDSTINYLYLFIRFRE